MIARTVVVIVMLIATRAYTASADREARVPRQALTTLPLTIGGWTGRDAAPFADDVLEQLGADEYVNRTYVGQSNVPISLYLGYYASQRQGDAIHSPQNCLPGAGWQPVETGIYRLDARGHQLA